MKPILVTAPQLQTSTNGLAIAETTFRNPFSMAVRLSVVFCWTSAEAY